MAQSGRRYYLWVDDYAFGRLGWPFGVDRAQVGKTTTLKIGTECRFRRGCSADLLGYVREWGAGAASARKISGYLATMGARKEQKHLHQRGLFEWSLFALPITYRRCGVEKQTHLEGEYELLRRGGHRILLLGGPATGKTTTVDRLCARPFADTIPVSIRGCLPSNREAVCDFISGELGLASDRHTDYLGRQGRLVLIVDGLGEMSGADSVVESVNRLTAGFPECRFIVTCRTEEYRDIGGVRDFTSWEISELDRDSHDVFLRGQPPQVQAAVSAALDQDPELQRLCGNQFMFLMAAEVLPEEEERPSTRARLYGRYLSKYLEWLKIPKLGLDQVEAILSAIAFEMRRYERSRTDFPATSLQEIMNDEYGKEAWSPQMSTE